MNVLGRKEPWWSIQLHGCDGDTLRQMYADGRITLAEFEAEVDRRLGVVNQHAGAVATLDALEGVAAMLAAALRTTGDGTEQTTEALTMFDVYRAKRGGQ